jgi:DnaK suppressor protein
VKKAAVTTKVGVGAKPSGKAAADNPQKGKAKAAGKPASKAPAKKPAAATKPKPAAKPAQKPKAKPAASKAPAKTPKSAKGKATKATPSTKLKPAAKSLATKQKPAAAPVKASGKPPAKTMPKAPAPKVPASKVPASKVPASKAPVSKAPPVPTAPVPQPQPVTNREVSKTTRMSSTPATKTSKNAGKTGTTPSAQSSSPKKAAATPSTEGKTFTPYELKKGEEYMNEQQKEHFKRILLNWRNELMQEVDRTVHHMQDEAANPPDPADRATLEEEFSIELRTRDRERRLIKKIDSTIELIANDDYGYCDSCGVEIGIRRLEARPTANKCIDCKTLDEIKEKQLGSP